MGGDGEKAEKKNFEWLKGSEDSVYFVALFRVVSSRENTLKRVMEGGRVTWRSFEGRFVFNGWGSFGLADREEWGRVVVRFRGKEKGGGCSEGGLII